MLLNSFLYQFFGNILLSAFNILIAVVLVRELSVESYGVYSLMTSLFLTSGLVLNLGFPEFLQQRIPSATNYQKKLILGQVLSIKIIAAILFIFILFCINSFLQFIPKSYLLFICTILILQAYNTIVCSSFMLINLRQALFFRLNLLSVVCKASVLLLFLRNGLSVQECLMLIIIAELIITFGSVINKEFILGCWIIKPKEMFSEVWIFTLHNFYFLSWFTF